MRASLRDVRQALGEVLGELELRVYDTFPAGSVQLPAAVVGWPTTITPSKTLGGLAQLTLPVTVLVALGADAGQAETRLDNLIGTDMAEALSGSHETWNYSRLDRIDNFRPLTLHENTPALAADFVVEILA